MNREVRPEVGLPEIVLGARGRQSESVSTDEWSAGREVLTPTGPLLDVHEALAALTFRLSLPNAEGAARVRDGLIRQLDDYLVPRSTTSHAPVVAVVGGPTGAGKSTVVNSLADADVSPAGVLRPTTRVPVLVCHPDDEGWFTTGGLLRDVEVRMVSSAAIPAGVAIVDAPDLDSVVESNRELGTRLLAAADLWIVVTTAARYADAVPWEALRSAHARGTALAVVLNRVPTGAISVVSSHLSTMLRDHGIFGAPMFVIPETALSEGRLSAHAIGSLAVWCAGLAADPEHREATISATFRGALANLRQRIVALSRYAAAQADTTEALRAVVEAAYAEAGTAVRRRLADGDPLGGRVRDEVRAADTAGELLRIRRARAGGLGRQLGAALSGRSLPGHELAGAILGALQDAVTLAVSEARDAVRAGWTTVPGGAELPSPISTDDAIATEARALVEEWRSSVLDLAHGGPSGRRRTTYAAAGTMVLVMIAALRLAPDLSVDAGVSELAERSAEDLDTRLRALFATDRDGWLAIVADVGASRAAVDRLMEASKALHADGGDE